MLFGMIVLLSVGILFQVLGLLLRKKQKLQLIHDYHVGKVKPEDVPAYTRLMGLGMQAIGAGCLLTGLIAAGLEQPLGWIALPLGLVVGVALFHKAQKTYNGGWFSP